MHLVSMFVRSLSSWRSSLHHPVGIVRLLRMGLGIAIKMEIWIEMETLHNLCVTSHVKINSLWKKTGKNIRPLKIKLHKNKLLFCKNKSLDFTFTWLEKVNIMSTLSQKVEFLSAFLQFLQNQKLFLKKRLFVLSNMILA